MMYVVHDHDGPLFMTTDKAIAERALADLKVKWYHPQADLSQFCKIVTHEDV
jgi:hypothetical protein